MYVIESYVKKVIKGELVVNTNTFKTSSLEATNEILAKEKNKSDVFQIKINKIVVYKKN